MSTAGVPARLRRTIASLSVAVLAIAACGGDSGDTGSSGGGGGDGDGTDLAAQCPVDALEDADGPVEVTVWHSYVGLTNETLNTLADTYNDSQDAVEVRVENQGAAYEELLRKYRQGIPTGDLPAIAIMEDTTTRFLADSGTLVPAAACAEADDYTEFEDFDESVLDYYTVDGVLQPGSFNVSSVLLYYNREHFERAGLDPDAPPTTLDEMAEAARAIKSSGIVEQPIVLNLQPWFPEYWLTGAGSTIVDNDNGRGDGETTASTFDDETTRELFDQFATLQADGLINPVPGVEGQFDHYFAMGLETSSMTLETSTAVTTINAVLEGNVDPADLGLEGGAGLPPIDVDLDVAEFPGLDGPGASQLGGGAWYMTNAVPDEVQAGAWDFIKFVNQPENQALWHLEGSYLPVRSATVDLPEVQAYWADTRPGSWLRVAVDSLAEVDPDFPGPQIGPYTETRDAIRGALDALFFGGASPDEAVSDADAAITEAIETYNDENF